MVRAADRALGRGNARSKPAACGRHLGAGRQGRRDHLGLGEAAQPAPRQRDPFLHEPAVEGRDLEFMTTGSAQAPADWSNRDAATSAPASSAAAAAAGAVRKPSKNRRWAAAPAVAAPPEVSSASVLPAPDPRTPDGRR